jgi:sporulation protein YlmC with PRC-barrel domain
MEEVELMDAWDVNDLNAMKGSPVYSSEGEKIGTVEDIRVDDDTGRPEWIGIGAGIFRSKQVLVPTKEATTMEDGLQVAWTKDHIKDSPDIDDNHLDPGTEADLYRHYDVDHAAPSPSGTKKI